MTTMTGRHVLGQGGVLADAGTAQMGGDAFALGKDLDRMGGQADLDGWRAKRKGAL